MSPWLVELKRFKHLIFLIVFVCICYAFYFYYYFKPLTNNAFVVANIRPVAAQVSGYIDKIYIKNGQQVKAGQVLFKVNDNLYRYKYSGLKHMVQSAKLQLAVYQKELANKKLQLIVEQNKNATAKERYLDAKSLVKTDSTSKFNYKELKNAYHQQRSLVEIAKNNILIADMNLRNQTELLSKLEYQLKEAKYNLNQTVVYAQTEGIISNMFISVGSPVIALKPLFSFIDSSQYWIQANFKETDLSVVKKNAPAKIITRMYGNKKIFKGVVVSTSWAVDRQLTDDNSYLPIVKNENQWTLLPQRLPVLIQIVNPDKDYPLSVGASAYVTLE